MTSPLLIRGVPLLLLILLSSNSVLFLAQAQTPKLPNIGYIGYGYNVFYGNPHATTQFDPGFGQAPIFDLTYNGGQTTPDGFWQVPDDVSVPGSATSCTVQGSSTTVQSASDYQTSLSVDAKVDLSGFGASFSASTDYKQVQQQTSSFDDVYVSTSASCQTYLVNINAYIHPNFSSSFISHASILPTTFDPTNATSSSAFWQLFDLVGTHFATQIIYGSRWGYSFQSTSNQWATLQQMNLDVNVAASYSGLIKAGVQVNTSYEQQMAQNFSQNTQNTYQYSLGNPPPSSGSTSDWLQSSLKSTLMDPLQYTLVDVSNLFSTDYSTDPNLNARQGAVSAALAQYCPSYLLANGKVSSCDLPPPPPPPPPPTGYGALACNTASDCLTRSAVVFDGDSNNQAQEVILDFCVGCTIATSFSGGDCLALSISPGNAWGYAVDPNETVADATANSGCTQYSNGNACEILYSGCSTPPPADAQWGAISCTSNCDSYFATPEGQGYPDRLEAHHIAMDQLGGQGTAFVIVDFDACGALVKGDNAFAASGGDTPQDAINAALATCSTISSNCQVAAQSCVDTSFLSSSSSRRRRGNRNKVLYSTSSSVPIGRNGGGSLRVPIA